MSAGGEDIVKRREGVKKAIAIAAFAVLLAGVIYWTCWAHHILDIV